MKKLIYILSVLLYLNSNAYSQAQYIFIEFKDAQRPAVQTEFSFSEKTVTSVIDDKLSKKGYKSKEVKGFTFYKDVILPELGARQYDLYFRADRKGRKDKDITVVTMLISVGNENFISSSSDSIAMNNANKFLTNLLPEIATYDIQLQVNAQQEAVSKAEKKYKSLQEDAEDLQKKKKRLEEQMEDNLKAQKEQQAEVEKQRQLYDAVRSKQKI